MISSSILSREAKSHYCSHRTSREFRAFLAVCILSSHVSTLDTCDCVSCTPSLQHLRELCENDFSWRWQRRRSCLLPPQDSTFFYHGQSKSVYLECSFACRFMEGYLCHLIWFLMRFYIYASVCYHLLLHALQTIGSLARDVNGLPSLVMLGD